MKRHPPLEATMPLSLRKTFVSPLSLYRDSIRLADTVARSGFNPHLIIAISRGGLPIGIVVHEFLEALGIKTSILTAHIKSYTGISKKTCPSINNCKELIGSIMKGSRLLIIDDIWDTGDTLNALCNLVSKKTGLIKTAVIYNKMPHTNSNTGPDFHIKNTTRWVVFPHELQGLSSPELARKDKLLHKFFKSHLAMKQKLR